MWDAICLRAHVSKEFIRNWFIVGNQHWCLACWCRIPISLVTLFSFPCKIRRPLKARVQREMWIVLWFVLNISPRIAARPTFFASLPLPYALIRYRPLPIWGAKEASGYRALSLNSPSSLSPSCWPSFGCHTHHICSHNGPWTLRGLHNLQSYLLYVMELPITVCFIKVKMVAFTFTPQDSALNTLRGHALP